MFFIASERESGDLGVGMDLRGIFILFSISIIDRTKIHFLSLLTSDYTIEVTQERERVSGKIKFMFCCNFPGVIFKRRQI